MWGYHLMVNAAQCLPATIRSAPVIEAFCRTLVKDIDMIAYGAPQIVMFGCGDKKGYTLLQLIETSNICCHFVEETNDLYLDVFSCKPFEIDTVKRVVQEYFEPKATQTVFVPRQAPRSEIPQPELR